MDVKDTGTLAADLERARAAFDRLSDDVRHLLIDLGAQPGPTRQAPREAPSRLPRELSSSAVSHEALVAFAQTVDELLGDNELSVEAARRAALVAAASQVWENELGPLYSSAQVRELLGDVSRQRIDELLRARRLVGLPERSGRRRFPAFQFRDARPLQDLIAAFWTVADGAASPWTAASWCVATDEALDGLSPAQWAREDRDAGRLARVAARDAARLAR